MDDDDDSDEPAVIVTVSAIVHATEPSSYWSCGHYCQVEEEDA